MGEPIRPKDLPPAGAVSSSVAMIVDNGATVQKATPQQLVDAVRPVASEAEAIAGVNNGKLMTPLRVAQVISGVVPTSAMLAAPTGSSLVGYQRAGAGALPRPVLVKLREVASSDDRTFNPAPLAEEPEGYEMRRNWGVGPNLYSADIGGCNNLAMGDNALLAAQYVRSSFAFCNDALRSVIGDQTGARAYGTYFALGDSNGAIGDSALRDCTTGYENLAIGTYALRGTTTGKWNVAIGHQSQILNTAGECNISLGAYALTVYQGNNSLAIGWAALEVSVTGSNCAIGHVSQNATTTGTLNTSLGAQTLQKNTTGNRNTAGGQEALANLESGGQNTAWGAYALSALLGAGTNNTGIGNDALVMLTSGNGNTALGAGAGNTITNLSNTLNLGAGASATKSDQAVIGNGNVVEAILPRVTIPNLVYAVGGLPTAASVGVGARAFVSDANSTTFASAVAAGGANNVPVYSDGSVWRIG